MKKESREFTLYGDLDGMTVGDLRNLLEDYHEDARIDARSETDYGWRNGGQREFFVIMWNEE